jgi:hypothetical protein
MREQILREIKRLALEQGGRAPGQEFFSKATGITPGKWRGVYWIKWSDVLSEAGFTANLWNAKHESSDILSMLAQLTRDLGRLPTRTEIRMQRRLNPDFPAHSTVGSHFPTNASMIAALRILAETEQFSDLLAILPTEGASTCLPRSQKAVEGVVYLLQMGTHYKIGRTENIERRIREMSIAMPESATLIHAIRTDDPAGIEAYWHRRFQEHRVNGEWFRLTGDDLRAFRRRTYQ